MLFRANNLNPVAVYHSHDLNTMAAKKRCQLSGEPRCNSAVLRLVGQCPHCRAEFCATVRPLPLSADAHQGSDGRFHHLYHSIVCRNIIIVRIWRVAGNRRLRRTRRNWRARGLWLPRWQWHDLRLLFLPSPVLPLGPALPSHRPCFDDTLLFRFPRFHFPHA